MDGFEYTAVTYLTSIVMWKTTLVLFGTEALLVRSIKITDLSKPLPEPYTVYTRILADSHISQPLEISVKMMIFLYM